MFSPLYLKIFEKSPFLMKTPTQNFAHHTEVKKHPFGVKTPILATLKEIVNQIAGHNKNKNKGGCMIINTACSARQQLCSCNM